MTFGAQNTRESGSGLLASALVLTLTRHMSGFRHRFINFVEIEPKPITAADKRTFSAIGQGDMYVYLPNEDSSPPRVLLKNVLYAPDMGVILVSISRIAAA